ncbi:hypothetical protein [Yersinia alsatica]|nr:hypothetical protein [Yersinia alsatica]
MPRILMNILGSAVIDDNSCRIVAILLGIAAIRDIGFKDQVASATLS